MSDYDENSLKQAEAEVEGLKTRIAWLEAEISRLHERYGERRWLDLTPDEGLPERILSAYIDDDYWSDNTTGEEPTDPVVVAMNEHRKERNAILRRALAMCKGLRAETERETP